MKARAKALLFEKIGSMMDECIDLKCLLEAEKALDQHSVKQKTIDDIADIVCKLEDIAYEAR